MVKGKIILTFCYTDEDNLKCFKIFSVKFLDNFLIGIKLLRQIYRKQTFCIATVYKKKILITLEISIFKLIICP